MRDPKSLVPRSLAARLRNALPPALLATAGLAAMTACSTGGGGGGGGQSGIVGAESTKPGAIPGTTGSTFFVDPNRGGGASRLIIEEMFWGRLVDVHDIDVGGLPEAAPLFVDYVINDTVLSDGADYLLLTNSVTQKQRLVILRDVDDPTDADMNGIPDQREEFLGLLDAATEMMPEIEAKNDDGSSAPPFSLMARNACLVIRFNDLLKDGANEALGLNETVRVLSGYPPKTPFGARLLFDPNFGGVTGGAFHSSRVLVDMTVSQVEAAGSLLTLQINSLGLPGSETTSPDPNLSVRIPSQTNIATGQFEILTALGGGPMSTNSSENGPVDNSSPTRDVVRAIRSGNPSEANNGFMVDQIKPRVVGGWASMVENPVLDPGGTAGLDFVIDVRFASACEAAPKIADVIQTGSVFLEVTQPGGAPVGGLVQGLNVRVASGVSVLNPNSLSGSATYLTSYDPAAGLPVGCWVSFTPEANVVPAIEVPTSAQVLVRFSEPVDPVGMQAFDEFQVMRGDAASVVPPIPATDVIVGEVNNAPSLDLFVFSPVLPFAHAQGTSETYHVSIGSVIDLGGNPLADALPAVDFTIDPNELTEDNAGFVMRFDAEDELEPLGFKDITGQIFYDLAEGRIFPRDAAQTSYPVDTTSLVIAAMFLANPSPPRSWPSR